MSDRKVRRVAANWQHPKNPNFPKSSVDEFIPLLSDYAITLQDWLENETQWRLGRTLGYKIENGVVVSFLRDLKEGEKLAGFDEIAGPRPLQENYMPVWTEEESTHYQMYETVSEGQPISPVMETPEALAQWMAENYEDGFDKLSEKEWLNIIQGNAVWRLRMGSGEQEFHARAVDLTPLPF